MEEYKENNMERTIKISSLMIQKRGTGKKRIKENQRVKHLSAGSEEDVKSRLCSELVSLSGPHPPGTALPSTARLPLLVLWRCNNNYDESQENPRISHPVSQRH